MSHTIVFKTDYGHTIEVLVEEYNELTGIASPADLSSYTTKKIIMKKPNGEIVYLDAYPVTGSGEDGYLQTTIASGILSVAGYYGFTVLLENELQRFHSAEFGTNVTVSIEQ